MQPKRPGLKRRDSVHNCRGLPPLSTLAREAAFGCLLLVIAGCGDGAGETTEPSGSALAAITVDLTSTIMVGQTANALAAGRDQKGAAVTPGALNWSSDAPYIASVSLSGVVTGTGTGSAIITATDKTTGKTGGKQVAVIPPPRPAGSFLSIGSDSIFQSGAMLYVSSVAVIDTTPAGKHYRIGIAREANARFIAPISRSSFPQFSAIAECPNGEAYATDFASSNNAVQLWRINLGTALIARVGELEIRPNTVSSMACDASNSLLIAANFASAGTLFRASRISAQVTLINRINETYLGITQSATGAIYGTVSEPFTSSSPQLLVTINTNTGVHTAAAGQQRYFPRVRQMAFRGTRLIGLTGGNLVQINTATGVVTTIRTVRMP